MIALTPEAAVDAVGFWLTVIAIASVLFVYIRREL